MSSLDKMSVMGVRSFAPKTNQLVYFFSPLTLILGPNGSGKTTIIEALRYVTTGDMPPNSGRGSAFIHDPKMADEIDVKAQIKLKFTDVRGNEVTTTRSILASQKQKRLELKSLDGTILRKDDTGKDVSISSKCAELDREMVSCLGVSKAILNNVIFCHQEDSNWPLSEGKSLKVKFDEIFAATRYIKALDNLHKIRVEQDNECKLFESELRFLEQNKKQAAELRADLQKTETRLAVSRDRVKRIQEKLKPIEDKLTDILKKERIVVGVHTQIASKEAALGVEIKVCQELQEKIVNTFKGTDEELGLQLDNFTGQLEEKKEEQRKISREIERVNREIPFTTSKRSDALMKFGKLSTEAEQHENRIAKRDDMVRKLCNTYALTGVATDGELSSAVVDRVRREMKAKIRSLEVEHQNLKVKYDEQETGLHQQMINIRDNKAKLEEKKSSATKDICDKRAEIQKISVDLTRVDAAAPRLQIIEAELTRKDKELEEATAEMNIPAAQSHINSEQREITRMEHEIRELDGELMKLHGQAEVQAKLELAKKDKASCEEAIRRLKSKHKDVLTHLLGSVPNTGIREAMTTLTKELSREVQKLRDKRDKLQVKIATGDSSLKMNMHEQQRKEAELHEYEERLIETCGSRNLEGFLNQLQTTIKNLHDEKGAMTGTNYLYNKFIEKLQKQDPCCPLCHRGFNDRQDVDDLVENLKLKLDSLPDEMELKQKALTEHQEKYNNMLELKPIKTRIEALIEKEIPELRKNVRGFDEDIDKNQSQLAEIEEVLMLKQGDESAATLVQPDLTLLEQNRVELLKAEKLIEQIGRQLGGDGGRTMAQVSREKKDLQTKLDGQHSSLKICQQRLRDHQDRVQGLQKQVNSLGSEQLEISRDMQKVNEMESRRSALTNDIAVAKRLVEDIKSKLDPLQRDIENLEKARRTLAETKDRAVEQSQQLIAETKAKEKEVVEVQSAISKYVDAKCQETFEECQKELELINANLKTLETKKQQMTVKWQNLSKEIDNQQTHVRDLKDSQELRRKQKRTQDIKRDIAKLKDDLGGYDIDTMETEKKSLNKQLDVLVGERHSAEGGQHELESNIAKLRKELAGSTYGDADKNHKEKLIQLRTTQLASKDLRKYSTALDGAIMQYHSLKMKEINKIVRDLWSTTYQGNDIDFIEIRSDVDDMANMTTSSGRRKQYRYRVVMIKGDVEQDMRGRCSAGQKVLASLIIRLALAETFCLNCGILALDEPTTNLDRENIESLAEALTNIVKARSQQRNFQLIVITHDEDFLERLCRSEFVDFYHRVAKNEKGHSVVKKFHVQTLP